jgi:hypothetical protein
MNEEPRKSLVTKLAEVMDAVGRVPKRGENTFHHYHYMTEADLVAAVRPELAKRSIMMMPTITKWQRTSKGDDKGFFTDVEITWHILDGETGEKLSFNMPGCGEDKGDKGLYKAVTGSEKYALKNLFLIPTGDDPEKDDDDKKTSKNVEGGSPAPKQSKGVGKVQEIEGKLTGVAFANGWWNAFIKGIKVGTNDKDFEQVLWQCDGAMVIATIETKTTKEGKPWFKLVKLVPASMNQDLQIKPEDESQETYEPGSEG